MKYIGCFVAVGLLVGSFTAQAGSLSLYATYWDADRAGDGGGGGLKLKGEVASLLTADFRGGYVEFSDRNVDLIPVEGSLSMRLPFFIEPYAGVGAGYYFADGKGYDDGLGWFGSAGLEIHLLMLGLFGEIRYLDLAENKLDGASANVGLMILW